MRISEHKIKVRLSDAELLSAFPEAKEIIPLKVEEFGQERKALVSIIEDYLSVINQESDEFSRWFWRKWLKLNEGEELLVIDRHIARLKRQLRIARGLPAPEGSVTDELIDNARSIPIESLFNQQFRRGGKTLIGLCPFHEEHTPSFHIYPKENRGWCFGCNQGDDVIGITMKLNSCGFKDAVLLLTGGQL